MRFRVGFDHGEIDVLAAIMETQPEPESVRKRYFLLHRFSGVDRGGALVLHHIPRHQVAAVGGRVEDHVVRAALDPALQHRLERFVGGIVVVEREIVAEDDGAPAAVFDDGEQRRQRVDVFAMNFDQQDLVGLALVDVGMRRLYQGRLAHAASAPKQRVVGRQPIGETAGVVQQDIAHPLDPLQQLQIDAVDGRHRLQPMALGLPDEGVGGVQIIVAAADRRQSLQCVGDSV